MQLTISCWISDGLLTVPEGYWLMKDKRLPFWTNLTVDEGQITWKNGNPLPIDFSFVPNVQQSNATCVTVTFDADYDTLSATVTFHQTDCEDYAHTICAISKESLHPQAPMEWHRPLQCPQGFDWQYSSTTGDCFWDSTYVTEHMSWDEARSYCQSFGADLASIHSTEEERFSYSYGRNFHWNGLQLDPETMEYKWSDGTALDYENWAPNQPDHMNKRLQCVSMVAKTKKWSSSLCGAMNDFICRASNGSNVPKSIQHTRERLIACDPNARWPSAFYFEGYCYQVFGRRNSWQEAKQHCQNEESSLVSIHTDTEMAYLLKLLYFNDYENDQPMWIGLNFKSGRFQWIDDSPLDLKFWNGEAPDADLNNETCVYMYSRNGTWNNGNCDKENFFICKWVKDEAVSPEVFHITRR